MPCNNNNNHNNPPDFHQKSLTIKHEDDKFFTRLISKESSKSNPSFRVYYGDVSSTVPFTWETIPGTPKHKSSEKNSNLPPLTPPPSYYTNNSNNCSKRNSRSKLLLHNLLKRMSPSYKKTHLTSSTSSHSSLSSLSTLSCSSSYSDPSSYVRKRRRFSSWGSSFDAKSMDDHPRGEACCFGGSHDHNGNYNYSMLFVKKALLSIVGRGGSA